MQEGDASPLRRSPRSPRSPYGQRSPRRKTLLDQLLQRSKSRDGSHGYSGSQSGYSSHSSHSSSSHSSLIPVLHRSGRVTHLLGRPLEVVQEVQEEFSDESDFTSTRRAAQSTPRVADLPAKVKWDTLLATREVSQQTVGCPATYLLKDRLKTRQISSSIMASRFSEPSDPGLSDLMVRECTWCRAALPANVAAAESERCSFVRCPTCHRRFDGRKAKTNIFGGPDGIL